MHTGAKKNLHINSTDCVNVNGVVYFVGFLFSVEYRSINGVGESLAVDFFVVGITSAAQTVQIHFLTIRMSQIRDALFLTHTSAHTWVLYQLESCMYAMLWPSASETLQTNFLLFTLRKHDSVFCCSSLLSLQLWLPRNNEVVLFFVVERITV